VYPDYQRHSKPEPFSQAAKPVVTVAGGEPDGPQVNEAHGTAQYGTRPCACCSPSTGGLNPYVRTGISAFCNATNCRKNSLKLRGLFNIVIVWGLGINRTQSTEQLNLLWRQLPRYRFKTITKLNVDVFQLLMH